MANEMEKLEKRLQRLEEKTEDLDNLEGLAGMSPKEMEKLVKVMQSGGVESIGNWQVLKDATDSTEARMKRLEARVEQVAAQVEASRKGAVDMADVKNVVLKLIDVEKRVKSLEGVKS